MNSRALRVAINGYGRIGRNVLRALHERGEFGIEIVAINDLGRPDAIAHLTRHDSTHGPFSGEVTLEDGALVVNGKPIALSAIADPADCPWRELDVDMVLECTGQFRARADSARHLAAGAKRVVIGAVGFDEPDATVVYGINHATITADQHVISASSCTTHCLAPVLSILNDAFGVERVLMTEIHASTSDQHLLDHVHRDLRRARAAGQSIIPTTTSSIGAVQKVLPWLAGRITGYSIRVPTQNVALVDLSVELRQPPSAQAINTLFRSASAGTWRGLVGWNEQPLVSIDFNHRSESAIFDATETHLLGNLAKLMVWYDNEW
ncbi:MAG: type I glyceraldehyde-3-phosphate dehydrogenase, partial [Actinomycetota bacterium]|nr:type I glyceraldehyde-3-phosphate dehydrogenase [Actinomycetota bacterium]